MFIKFIWQYYYHSDPLKELESMTDLKFDDMDIVFPQIYQYVYEKYKCKNIDISIFAPSEMGKLT